LNSFNTERTESKQVAKKSTISSRPRTSSFNTNSKYSVKSKSKHSNDEDSQKDEKRKSSKFRQ